MKLLRGLTSSAGLACLLTGVIVAGGCATHGRGQKSAAVPIIHGSANLDILVRHHPGWSGVTRYDEALRRLGQAEEQSPRAYPVVARATVPALAVDFTENRPAILPALLRSEQSRLKQIQASHIADLRARRDRARRDQLARQATVWQSAAARMFPMPGSGLAIQPDLALQLQRVNVEQLTRTVQNWSLSPLAAPGLRAVRAKLARAQADLSQMLAHRVQAASAAQLRQAEAVTRVNDARIAYVVTQATQRASLLRADDDKLIAAQQRRLSGQQSAALRETGSQMSAFVPASGSIAAQALPTGPEAVRALLSQESLAAAATHLRVQRARWILFLYDDTRAAALDTARQRGWQLTFTPPRAGERDLTMPLAQALATGAWRSEASG